MIEIFKTNVKQRRQAKILLAVLLRHFPYIKVNFDLDDCDRILRVEGNEFCKMQIAELITTNGYECQLLD